MWLERVYTQYIPSICYSKQDKEKGLKGVGTSDGSRLCLTIIDRWSAYSMLSDPNISPDSLSYIYLEYPPKFCLLFTLSVILSAAQNTARVITSLTSTRMRHLLLTLKDSTNKVLSYVSIKGPSWEKKQTYIRSSRARSIGQEIKIVF
jgi:hypothetical protein